MNYANIFILLSSHPPNPSVPQTLSLQIMERPGVVPFLGPVPRLNSKIKLIRNSSDDWVPACDFLSGVCKAAGLEGTSALYKMQGLQSGHGNGRWTQIWEFFSNPLVLQHVTGCSRPFPHEDKNGFTVTLWYGSAEPKWSEVCDQRKDDNNTTEVHLEGWH